MSVEPRPSAPMPADVERPDKIAFGLTFRQVAILAGFATVAVWVYQRLGPLLLAPLWWAIAAAGGIAVFALVTGRRDGIGLDRWLAAAIAYTGRPKRLTPTPASGPTLARTTGGVRLPGVLRLPATAIGADGIIALPGGGHAAMIAATTVNLGLRTAAEQQALLAGFGALLNALSGPAQITVSARPMDLCTYADAVAQRAQQFDDLRMRGAAADHAEFLRTLAGRTQPLRRHVIITVTGRDRASAARHAADAARTLGGLGVRTVVLDGPAAAGVLAAACTPLSPPAGQLRAPAGTPIVRRPT